MSDCLKARGLRFSHGSRALIDDISMTLQPGEMVTLIGPNGAGKSTLLRLLTGFLTPETGECWLDNRPLKDWPRELLAQRRAVMRQQNSVSFPMTAAEVVAMGRAPWPGSKSKAVTQEVMHITGSLELAKRDYQSLSGGEQQRVQLARVLAQLWYDDGPHGWLFLDEPTSALDLFWQQHSLRLLHRLTRNGCFSVCTVLHDLNLASLWSDRVLILHQGKIVAEGTPHDVMTEKTLTRWYQAELDVVMQDKKGKPQIQLRV